MFKKFLVKSLLGVLKGKRDASAGGYREAGPERAGSSDGATTTFLRQLCATLEISAENRKEKRVTDLALKRHRSI
jgi:hypothetical protein